MIVAAVAIVFFPGCDGKTSNTDSAAPQGCADALGTPAAHSVDCSPQEKCDQVHDQPSKKYEFTLTFDATATATAEKCLATFLNDRGATATLEDWNGLDVSASFDALLPALSYSIVMSYSVLGCAGGCTYCAALPTDECAADAFCQVVTARRFDAVNKCLEPVQNVGCQEDQLGCVPEPHAVVDLQNACWEVDCGGVPDQWTSTDHMYCDETGVLSPACP